MNPWIDWHFYHFLSADRERLWIIKNTSLLSIFDQSQSLCERECGKRPDVTSDQFLDSPSQLPYYLLVKQKTNLNLAIQIVFHSPFSETEMKHAKTLLRSQVLQEGLSNRMLNCSIQSLAVHRRQNFEIVYEFKGFTAPLDFYNCTFHFLSTLLLSFFSPHIFLNFAEQLVSFSSVGKVYTKSLRIVKL